MEKKNHSTQPMSIFDVIDDDMFQDSVHNSNRPKHSESDGNGCNPFCDVPDSELGATELRQKYDIGDTKNSGTNHRSVTKNLLINNFYTIDTSCEAMEEEVAKRESIEEVQQIHHDSDDFATEQQKEEVWETVDHEWIAHADFPGNSDHLASWFNSFPTSPESNPNHDSGHLASTSLSAPLKIFPNHIPIVSSATKDLEEGDMDAARLAGTPNIRVNARVLIHNLTIICRCYSGKDWADHPTSKQINNAKKKKSEELLNALLEDEYLADQSRTFSSCPDEEFQTITNGRLHDKYFELSVLALKLRTDSFIECCDHRLASCMYVEAEDLYLSETFSSRGLAQKMLGDWVDDLKHPRDANDGILMMKMVSMFPENRISVDGKLVSMESRVAIQLLPLRCHINQGALRDICGFFSSDESEEGMMEECNDSDDKPSKVKLPEDDQGTFFQTFHIKPCKLKVNYTPVKLNAASLRAGSYAELLNLFPLENIELLLQPLTLTNLTGWGGAIGETLRSWMGDIVSTQVHKVLQGAPGVNSISQIGSGAYDLIMMPVKQYRRERKIGRGLKKGTSRFVSVVALETLNTTHRATRAVANLLNRAVSTSEERGEHGALPSRPGRLPVKVDQTFGHSRASVRKGLKAAHHTIVTIPRREYLRNGTTGAIKCIVKNVPVAVLAPLSGATEALSYTVLGVRNQIRPDVRKEDESRHVLYH